MSTIALHSTLNTSETVRGLDPKDQSSSGAGTHRNAVPVPFLTTGTPFRFLFVRTVVRSAVVIRGLMLLETDHLFLIVTRCDIGDFLGLC